MSNINRGREALLAWDAAQPKNYYTADTALQRLLARLVDPTRLAEQTPGFERFGEVCATVLDRLVREVENRQNLPRLERFSALGERTEEVVFGAGYDEIGRHIYGSGMISVLGQPGSMLRAAVLAYLSNQNGEAGHNCPVACTAGIVRALQAAGSDELKRRFLPGLLTADYDQLLDGAQFLTEVQGGSDVGANACVATPIDEAKGLWRIDGEKWFCSNISGELFLMTARPAGAPDGTRGLGLFLVPRRLEDGSVNGFSVRRLKDKLGTRAMASGEADFHGCLAYAVGSVDHGFSTVMNHVINTSRLYNAVGTLAMARRALVTAWTYAQHRQAFGQPIGQYPLVQETLADMRSELAVLLAGTMELLHLRDRLDLGQADEIDLGFFRVAVNLNKYRTAVSAGEIIRSALEVLGGNGAIETFSVVPRLLRDNVVYENWEGTHNTLRMQVLRDMQRLGVGRPFLAWIERRFRGLQGGPLEGYADQGLAATARLAADLQALADVDPGTASLRMRPLGDRMSWLFAAACGATQAAWEIERHGDETAARLLDWYWTRRLAPAGTLPDAQTTQALARLAAGV